MVLGNRDAVLRQVESVRDFLAELSAALADGDVAAVERHFAEGRGLRGRLLDRSVPASVRSFPAAGPGGPERDFLLALGASGGYLTGCSADGATVTYSVGVPER
jgi:prephenate dehydrogenase